MLICGIKVTHDGAVALIDDNRLIFSIEMEKLNNNERHEHIDDLQIVFDCLAQYGYDAADVDQFVIDGWRNTSKDNKMWGGQQIRLDLAPYRRGFLSADLMQAYSFKSLDLNYLSYPHYAGHLASAYCTSPMAPMRESSYVVCWDGPMFPYLYHVDAASNSVRTVGPLFFLRGGTYHYLSQKYPPFNGPTSWAIEAALPGKIMAYAAVGTPQPHAVSELDRAYKHAVHSVLGGSAVPDSALNERASRQIREVMREVLDDSGVSADDMIASIQEYIGDLFVRSLVAAVESDGRVSRNLCFAGGCALNIKWNRQIRDLGLFDTVWVPPFPNDSGSAIGAASCAVFDLAPEPTVEWNVYSGPALLPTAPEPGWRSSVCSIAELAERLHVRGEPVVMLSGRAELGPRALGHRSILAPATDPEMKGTLNRIKGREAYRPVAPICLEHRSSEVFMPGGRDAYMLFDHRVRESWRSKVPAICHLDGSARLQTVSSSDEPVIFELLSEYEKRSGVPLLCNTSANLNGRGFFPDVASAMRWGGVPAIWSDGVLYERQ